MSFDLRDFNGYMYPTFSWCKGETNGIEDCSKTISEYVESLVPKLFEKDKDFKPERYDIVRTKNIIDDNYFIGRIIGLPGEEIEFKNGYVYINGAILDEPYLYIKGSTYGDGNLSSCQKLKIGNNQVFVMGDNRLVSSYFDSRNKLGLVAIENITHYLPFDLQLNLFKKRWNNFGGKNLNLTDEDRNQEVFNEKLVKKINEYREQKKLDKVTVDNNLIKLAEIKAKKYLDKKIDDLDVDYFNSILSGLAKNHEIFYLIKEGFYNIDDYFDYLRTSNFIQKKTKFIGVALKEKENKDCNNKVIVIIISEIK